nr:MAG TPA: hypothetical protein [Caudoviricetes sp.]
MKGLFTLLPILSSHQRAHQRTPAGTPAHTSGHQRTHQRAHQRAHQRTPAGTPTHTPAGTPTHTRTTAGRGRRPGIYHRRTGPSWDASGVARRRVFFAIRAKILYFNSVLSDC